MEKRDYTKEIKRINSQIEEAEKAIINYSWYKNCGGRLQILARDQIRINRTKIMVLNETLNIILNSIDSKGEKK